MSRKLVVASIAAATVLLLAVPVVLSSHRSGVLGEKGGHGHGGFAKLHALHDELDLTDAQKKALHEIFDRTREQNAEAKRSLHTGFIEAAQILLRDPSNIAGARAVVERQEAAADQLKANILVSASDALKLLTPEQRQKLSEVLAEQAAKRD